MMALAFACLALALNGAVAEARGARTESSTAASQAAGQEKQKPPAEPAQKLPTAKKPASKSKGSAPKEKDARATSSRSGIVHREYFPQSNITVDGNERLFATMCALHAAGFEAGVNTAGGHPMRAQLKEMLQRQQGPAVDALREYYKQHELSDPGATLSRYIWFALVAGPAPKFQYIVRRDEMPPEVLGIEDFNDVLAAYYLEQNIRALWQKLEPAYDQEIARLHEPVTQIVTVSTSYLRQIIEPSNPRTFAVLVEPLVGRKTNVLNLAEHYAIVLGGVADIPTNEIRHAFLHFMLDPMALKYPHVIAVKRPLLDIAARAPRLPEEFKEDFPSFFTECLVRAVEIRLQRLSPGQIGASLDRADANGFVLVRPLLRELARFEKSEPSMTLYFADLVRAIDTGAEAKRLQSVQFSTAAVKPSEASQTEGEPVKPKPPARFAGMNNDPEVVAALTEGERQISLQHPEEAKAAFEKVLRKYPDHSRAWYGMALIALLEGKSKRAMELLEILTGAASAQTSDHGGTGRANSTAPALSAKPSRSEDPLVLAWSHFYLGRMYDDDGEHQRAVGEYRAAVAVPEGPERARNAAQRALDKSHQGPLGEKP